MLFAHPCRFACVLVWLTGTLSIPPLHAANGPVTFNRDIAPIVFESCTPCHRPGESGPFSLLSYSDVRKHARQIVTVTKTRYMPPWLPEHGFGEFAGERRLTDSQIALFERWVEEGTAEGDPRDLPPPPRLRKAGNSVSPTSS